MLTELGKGERPLMAFAFLVSWRRTSCLKACAAKSGDEGDTIRLRN